MAKVVILGAGVAGLSAAHELVERGFAVEVYEKRARSEFGGKARSLPKRDTAREGRKDLPGEHGFRFFPGFYRHLTDTMSRIPYPDGPEGVFGNLVNATACQLSREKTPPMEFPIRRPHSFGEFFEMLKPFLGLKSLGPTTAELWYFAWRMLRFMVSCTQRREQEYEAITWWRFIGARRRSEEYQKLLADGITRSLVAMKAQHGSARSVGTILVQMLLDLLGGAMAADRVLNGPTSDVWIQPWVEYLEARGVRFHAEFQATKLHVREGAIAGVTVTNGTHARLATGDYYVAAVPVEIMEWLLRVTPEIMELDPGLKHLRKLRVEWMNGIQFFLKRDVEIVHGHAIYLDSPWALTSISQRQFWSAKGGLSGYGDGGVRGIISVDISDWNTPGSKVPVRACNCEPNSIAAEVWDQLKVNLAWQRADQLHDDDLLDWFLDPGIQPLQPEVRALKPSTPLRGRRSVERFVDTLLRTDAFPRVKLGRKKDATVENAEPLLINTIRSLECRPNAKTRIPNLFLASDYVRTHTDLATMEAANEAARRAVNGILLASRSKAPACCVWPLSEPWLLAPLRWLDQLLFWIFPPKPALGAPPALQPPSSQRLNPAAGQLPNTGTTAAAPLRADAGQRQRQTTC